MPAVLVILLIGGGIGDSLKNAGNASGEKLIVDNWGEYIDPETLDMFEKETGISVTYEEYETNEIMYPKI